MPLRFHYKPKLVTMAAKLDPSLHFGDEMINVVGYKVLKSWPFLEKKYRIEIMPLACLYCSLKVCPFSFSDEINYGI